jgi:hypothetical protein
MKIINKSFEINVNNVIKVIDQIFPNLKQDHKNLIKTYTLQIIEYIACRFCFNYNKKGLYYEQFYQNDFRDIKSVINLLLPYIDDKNGTYELHKQVYTLSDIARAEITNINHDRSLNGDDKSIYRFGEIDLEINKKLILDTLNVVSNKLYVNWLNCLPYTLSNYKKSLLWKESYKFDGKNFDFPDKDIKTLRYDFKYYGIHIYDIYNCCNQFLFQHILPTKWLLYEKLLEKNKKPVMYIEELTDFFDLDLLLKKKKWELLSDEEKTNLRTKWYRLLSSANKAGKGSLVLTRFHLGIVKNIILHYESYNNSYEIFTPKIYNEEEKDEKEREEKKNIKNDYTVIIEGEKGVEKEKQVTADEFIKLVDANYKIDVIYNYLIISINEFYKTWFGKKIIKDNKIINLDIKLENITGKNIYLTYKNIYNFAKSLCYDNHKYITEARCLSDDDLGKFINKIDETAKFTNVLKLTYQEIYSDIDNYTKDILENISLEIKKMFMEIVFESHIMYGLLSKFTPVKEVTDNYYKSNITNNIQTIIFDDKNIKDFKDSYYFLTNDKYENLTCYHDNKTINYIDLLKINKDMHWFKPFALDWIYQMQFNHRFLNNRLIYVTGATGQGKSTQVPKLLYYATKAFCCVMNPRVVSTQPRIKPTTENAKRISDEMGVPIEVKEGVNTFLDYLQYSTKEDKHKYNNVTFIREVIDKILCDELLKEPLLENNYNVIIVDEAHEHNINMDLILTLMKSTLYFNNKIRFIITSATIEKDEPIYRKYYRNIDDNLLFPCNRNLLDENNKLDRIVIDRRTHISPPGETTRFKVTDIWEERDPKDYEEAEKIGIKRAIEIAKNNDGQGDVLFFSIGAKEIQRICKELNEKIPSHAIALPYYSELPEAWKIIATKPEERKNKLNFDKTKLFDIIDEKTVEESENNNYKYTTVIIVATNVAEASITIGNLKFVIDTGYVKSMPFDIITNKKDSKIICITNMNRLQRRGRVGRISDGTVHYTYTENFLNKVEPNYNIKNSDFTINVFKFLTSSEEYITETINEDKLIQKTNKNYIEYKTETDEYIKNINGKNKIFFKNNYNYDKKTLFNPQGIQEIRNLDVLKVPRRYIDGKFSIIDIRDEDNEFYLIHPGNIDLYYKNCKIKKYILTTSEDKDIKNEYIQQILDVAIDFTQIFGQDEDESIPMINTLIHSIRYNCLDDVVKILIWLFIIKLEPYKICNKGQKIKNKSNYSDLLVLLELEKMFVFDRETTIKDLTPSKEKLQLFIDWMNDPDNNKWFYIPEEYKIIYEYIFNKNTELGELQFNLKYNNLNGIIKDDIIKKYIELYKKMIFSFNEEYIDNELLKNNKLINGYKKIKEIAGNISINRTNNHIHNILKSFFSGYNYIILSCNHNEWKRKDIPDNKYNPHKDHFLERVNGLYFAIGCLKNRFDVLQPMILSKILDDNWIDEIKLINS